MLEREYQAGLIKRIYKRFPGCYVEKTDPNARQGNLDLNIFLVGGMWAKLEVKRSKNAPLRPNQQYYVDHYNAMGFARIIHPENEEAILDELQQEYENYRAARIP